MELNSEVKRFERRKNGGARVALVEFSTFIFSKDEQDVKSIVKKVINKEYEVNERILASKVTIGGKRVSKFSVGISFLRDSEDEDDFFDNILNKIIKIQKNLKKYAVKDFPVSVEFNTLFNSYFQNSGAINFVKKEGYRAGLWKKTYVKGTLDCNYSIEIGKFVTFKVTNGNVNKDNFEKAIDNMINDIAYFNNSYYKS